MSSKSFFKKNSLLFRSGLQFQLISIVEIENLWPRQKIKVQFALALALPIAEDSVLFMVPEEPAL